MNARRIALGLSAVGLLVVGLVGAAGVLGALLHGAPRRGPPTTAGSPNVCLKGIGSFGWCGDGGPATRARLGRPDGVAVAANGAVVIADTANQVIRRVEATGRIETIAGSGRRGFESRPTPAGSARFADPTGVAIDDDGSVLVADAGNNAIRRIGLDGVVSTLSHSGLSDPAAVAVAGSGRYAVADTGHNRVVMISAAGTVTPFAGTGTAGFAGDGGPADQARLDAPVALAESAGGLLIADTRNQVIRRVNHDGTIETVAGGGATSSGTPAARLVLSQPAGVAPLAHGGFAFSDVGRIWAVASDGSPQPLAGSGVPGFSGDDGAALSQRIDHPGQLATTANDDVLFADTNNDRLRRIRASGDMSTVAGSDRPQVALAPVLTAPFAEGHSSDAGGPDRYRSRKHRRGRHIVVPVSPASRRDGNSPPPSCAVGSPNNNYLKIQPYTETLISSTRHPVIIAFGMSVDARVTGYAWRSGHKYGRRSRSIGAGSRTIHLKGSLSAGHYVAVVEGVDDHQEKRCDSRKLLVRR